MADRSAAHEAGRMHLLDLTAAYLEQYDQHGRGFALRSAVITAMTRDQLAAAVLAGRERLAAARPAVSNA